jgi:hypothetical protein
MKKKSKSIPIIIFVLFVLTFSLRLFCVSTIYDRIGIISEHGLHGAVPEENIDLFNGNLTLKFQDIRLPGPNGFDTVVWRVYNSKLDEDHLLTTPWPGYQQSEHSWVGFGWIMHMGRLHEDVPGKRVVEFPDGRREGIFNSVFVGEPEYHTQSFLKYDPASHKLYFKDGTVWTFGAYVSDEDGNGVRVVTLIENSYGHTITVEYQPVMDGGTCMKRITDSMGRTINFTVTNNRLSRITVKDALGNNVNYDYTVDTYGPFSYTRLARYKAPEIPACTFEYDGASVQKYELTAMNTAYGGRLEYQYNEHTFYHHLYGMETRVVTQKRIRYNAGGTFKTWVYNYPS